MDLPAAFVERLHAELGADAERILASMAAPKRTAYWINPLRDGDTPTDGVPLAGVADVFASTEREALTRHPAAQSGRIYLLNPSSTLAVRALAPQPGEAVLDLAAAPGGKTLLTAARMGNTGSILAVEPVRGRFHRMMANLERCGVAIARFQRGDGRRLDRRLHASFDRVLLDAPCSSEARFRTDAPQTTRYWSPRKVGETTYKQRGLIRAAFAYLKPGGTLVYCTCAFSRRENEGVVGYLLRREPTARLEALDTEHWPAAATPGSLPGTLRILPDADFDGFFIARLTRIGGGDA